MEAFESDVEWRNGLGRTVVCRDDPNESFRVQANDNTGVFVVSATAERRLSDHIIRVANTELDHDSRPLDYRDPILSHVGHHQVRLEPGGVRVVILRGPKTVDDVVLRRHGAVRRTGRVRQRRSGGVTDDVPRRRTGENPVVSVRRHVVRVKQFHGRARVPVDHGVRTAAHLCQGDRRSCAGVLFLFNHVRRHESVPGPSGGPNRAVRIRRVRRRVADDGRLRVFRRTRNAGKKFQRNRRIFHEQR